MTNKPTVVSVGRNTFFGNPVRVGVKDCPVCEKSHESAAQTLDCFREYLWWRMKGKIGGFIIAQNANLPGANMDADAFCKALINMYGKVLVCPGCGVNAKNCHARVLEKAIAWLKGES